MNRLKVINLKSLSEIEIKPMGKSFTLEGRNGAGKTAIIDAIRWALQGNAFMSEDAMKKGADKTEVIYEDDTVNITRSMKRGKNPTVKVTDKLGTVFQSPQKMLDEIVSNLSFDPTDFLLMKPEEQVKALRELVDPEGKIAKLEMEEKGLYDKRRDVGRDLDTKKKALSVLPKFDATAGLDEKSRTEIMGRYEEAHKVLDNIAYLQKAVIECDKDIRSFESEIENLQRELESTKERRLDLLKEAESLPKEKPNLESIKAELDNVDSQNAKIRDNQTYKKTEIEMKEIESWHTALEAALSLTRDKINQTIKASPIPVEGMAFDENGITLDGKRFDECSDGERLEASLRISMALNKGLKMIAIRNGSLLDQERFEFIERQKRIMDFAREQGYQVIMEIVGTGEIQVEIESEIA